MHKIKRVRHGTQAVSDTVRDTKAANRKTVSSTGSTDRNNTKLVGDEAELLARGFLEAKNYRFLDSNFIRRLGEIDLVMLEPAGRDGRRTIVFVEVRFRGSAHYGGALASIDWQKQRKLLRVASLWLQKHACSKANARIDLIAIEPLRATTRLTQPDERIWRGHHLIWIENAVESS